jgi:NADH-quinone oxidoreductase subunit G
LLGIKPGEPVKVSIGKAVYELEAALRPDVPRGVALMPAGIPPVDGASIPAQGQVTPVNTTVYGAVR